eukprot:GGOE01062253.1.p1 GENE.GGOE01062253.1~~GGOE01062253.1.p1  ORF type:complete len:839 (+),score=170.37 GGOE01062253.1:189-2519(+)
MLGDFPRSLADADAVVALRPDWAKGWSRRGAALQQLRRFPEAKEAYSKGLELDPDNEIVKGALAEVMDATTSSLPPYVNDMPPEMVDINTTLELRQLTNVTWHLEVLKDRIWLSDPPKLPFRPRSVFLIDPQRQHLLNMLPHPQRESISLHKVTDFILQTCHHTTVRPGTLEVADPVLHRALEPLLRTANIIVQLVEVSSTKQQFLQEVVASFEAKEEEYWAKEPDRFGPVLRQRRQRGLLSIPGVSVPFLWEFFATAAQFVRSRVYLYYTGSLRVQFEGESQSTICTIIKNQTGQYGITLGEAAPGAEVSVQQTSSLVFCEESSIPFEDADLIEQHGLEVMGGHCPLPLVHSANSDEDFDRPSHRTLVLWGRILRVLMLFIGSTLGDPASPAKEPLCYHCHLEGLDGPNGHAVVTVPLTAHIPPQGVLREGASQPQPQPQSLQLDSFDISSMHSELTSPPSSLTATPVTQKSFSSTPIVGTHCTGPTQLTQPMPAAVSDVGCSPHTGASVPLPALTLCASSSSSPSPPSTPPPLNPIPNGSAHTPRGSGGASPSDAGHLFPPAVLSPTRFKQPSVSLLVPSASAPAVVAPSTATAAAVSPATPSPWSAISSEVDRRLREEQQRSARLEVELQQATEQLQFQMSHTQQQKTLIDHLQSSLEGLQDCHSPPWAVTEVDPRGRAAMAALRAELDGRTRQLLDGMLSADRMLTAWMEMLEAEALLKRRRDRRKHPQSHALGVRDHGASQPRESQADGCRGPSGRAGPLMVTMQTPMPIP